MPRTYKGFWSQAARVAVPAILVIVAVGQLFLAHTVPLTPWKGGGFGMFASMDQLETRFARIELLDANGESLPVAIDRYVDAAASDDLLERARAMPDRYALGRIAADVGEIGWIEDDGVAVPARQGEPDTKIEVDHIRVSVWVYTFQRSERALVPEQLAGLTVPRP